MMSAQKSFGRANCGIGLLVLLASITSTSADAAQPNGWIITQSSQLYGKQRIFVTPASMKIESFSYTALMQAPSYSSIVFNQRTKCYFASNYSELKKRLQSSSRYADKSKVVRGASAKIGGVKATQFFFEKARTGQAPKRIEFWVTNELGVPPQFIEGCAKLCEIPAQYGFPLRVIRSRNDGGKMTVLDTSSCERASIPASTWQAPTGYKLVKDEVSVIMGDADIDDLVGRDD